MWKIFRQINSLVKVTLISRKKYESGFLCTYVCTISTLCPNKIPNYFFRNNQQTYKDTLLKQFKHLQPQDPSTNLQTTTKLKLLLLLRVVHVITNKTMKFKLEPRWKMLLWALKNKKKTIFFFNNETSFFSIKTHLTVVLYYFPLFHGHSRSV